MSNPLAYTANAPSMPAGSHEMREYPYNQYPPQSTPQSAPSITPYLGLRARLSQVWINRWTILLLLVLARTLITMRDINHDLASARREALSACITVEDMGSTVASLPHYMSDGLNELTADGMDKAVNGLFQMATMSITGVEEIVLFVINMMTSTYLCLITLAISGSLHSVIGVLEDANNQLQTVVGPIGDDIASQISSFNNALQSLNKTLSDVSVLGQTVKLPDNLDVSGDLDKLKNVSLPSSLDADLQKLNSSIPTFTQVQNFTNNAISVPFDLLKQQVNQSLGTFSFDRSLFPVPEKQQLTFCSNDNGINDFFNGLGDLVAEARKIFIGILVSAAILAMIPMGYREVRRWRTQLDRSRLVAGSKHDPMDVVYIVSRPYTSTFGIKVSSRFDMVRRQALVRWIVAYATTEAALFVLALGVAGLFTCLCHFIFLKAIEREVPALTDQVGQFADQVIARLNNASGSWSAQANSIIAQKGTEINNDMFGWVNASVTAINDTMNVFVNDTIAVLNTTFGGTPLQDPIVEVFNCLLGLKIASAEKALTWVQENARVNFPTLPNDTFSIGALASLSGNNDSSFLASPGDQASNKISATVTRVTSDLYDDIRTEAIISTIVVAVWFILVLIGVVRALILWNGRDKVRGIGGGGPPISSDFGHTNQSRSVEAEKRARDFRSDDQDRFTKEATFTEIPLHDVQHQPPTEPAPGYSRNDPFGDDKAVHYVYGGEVNHAGRTQSMYGRSDTKY